MWISTLAAEATNDPGRGPVVVWIAVSVGGYASAIAGLFTAWTSEKTASGGMPTRAEALADAKEDDKLHEAMRREDLGEASRILANYRVHSILRLHRLADLMLILAITAVIAGPLAGFALGSYLAGGIIGGIAGPAYTAHRRLEKAAAHREASADLTDRRKHEAALRSEELQRKHWELEREKQLFRSEMEQKRAEQQGT
ncbi:hypothetical protein ACIBG0_17140 [Nocardia sp. NPDC050630]|uniref:hypothetical protein n=1 Tax=Nocardia sp. NPDC050630 TaxID=3364321 RepID=UPI0037ABB075